MTQQARGRQPDRHDDSTSGDSGITVVLAGAANLLIAVAKLVAGIVSGSAAMLSEAAHSFADTLNQLFLMAALRRSSRPADEEHPFGYGKERYFWSLLAAVAVFVLGAGFSIFQGVKALVSGEREGSPVLAFIVLGLAAVLEGTSLVRAIWQLRNDARAEGESVVRHLRTAEPTLRGVFFEDSAAMLGLVFAAAGLALDELLDSTVFDAVASLLVGVLLIGVAFTLGESNRDLLIGRAVDNDLREQIRTTVRDTPGIRGVMQVLTMQMGADDVLLAVKVDIDDDETGEDVERVADDVERRVRESYPEVQHVFVDPTPGTEDDVQRA
ncbi:cation diffusion facilitator transporter [Marmoricola endophyticus]|uniref:Cation diffusion facilitator transporter n=1 Tax=Marmoricola endophyticus TaxID=2040280 RepID=A0A917BJU8_9ACTN|nr:cation diffusion facilitator family transporter [Marmoricola endophyticus]GGF46303.1 cation diffusion facilitator transporter [Marmoricola endophyticus]